MKAIHPGEHLAEELKEMGMSAAELSRQLRVPTNRVTQILNGRRYRRHRFKAGAAKIRVSDQGFANDQGYPTGERPIRGLLMRTHSR